MLGCRLLLLGLLLLCELVLIRVALAAPPTFERRVWGQSDGAPPSAYGIAQDSDGMLWFPTVAGLYNFDGVRFAQVSSVYGHALQSNNLISIAATRDGLAVGYQFGGVSVFTQSEVRHYGSKDGLPPGAVESLLVDRSGRLYANTGTQFSRLDNDTGKWTPLLQAAVHKRDLHWEGVDDNGTVWITDRANKKLYALAQGTESFREIASLRGSPYLSIIKGKLIAHTGKGQVTEFSLADTSVVAKVDADAGLTDSPFEGPYGTWWAWLRGGTSLLRAGDDGVLRVAQEFEGGSLPGKLFVRSLVDRENNLWVSTLEGVERYRVHRLYTLPLPSGAVDFHVSQGLADEMLVTSRDEKPVQRWSGNRLLPMPGALGISAIYKQGAGSIWLGGSAGIFHLTNSGMVDWAIPSQVKPNTLVQSIVTDNTGAVLVSFVRNGLYRLLDGRWTKVASSKVGDDTPISMHTGASGRTYLGFTQGRLAELTPSGVQMISTSLSKSVGNILSLLEHNGKVFVSGDHGVILHQDGQALALRPQRIGSFSGISGMVIDHRGALWLHGPKGLFHVPAQELEGFLSDPHRLVGWEVFNFEDGLRGQVAQIRPLPSLTLANDGKVYYATSSQVGWIDPSAIRRNQLAPTVIVTSVRFGDTSAPAKSDMRVPAGTTTLDINFTATALSIPERVKFRYRLDGVDQDWQQPGPERAARYTNLGPGSYRFQVKAANEDGVWNDTGAFLKFEIAPTIWQTYWFRAIVIGLLVSSVVALYRWRIAAVARLSAEKSAARVEERERIARSLHDNLLQGVQGLILSCHAILMRMPTGTPEERQLGQALARADLMIEETRDEVMDLRSGSARHDLASRLQRSIAKLGSDAEDRVKLEFTGAFGRLDPAVASEMFYVLQEAIANSIQHSGSKQVRVIVDASESGLRGLVQDDGRGMASSIIENGKVGHWGLIGMRERVHRLGGTLTIDSQLGVGTTVTISVPA